MYRSITAFVGIAFLALLFVGDGNASAPPQKFRIYVNGSECLGIAGGSNRDGGLLVVERCAAKGSQVFEIYAAPGPTVRQTIKTASGSCIDIPGGNTNDGSIIQQWDCDRSDEQAFQLPVWTRSGQPVNVGRILAPHSGKCFDASNRPTVRQNTCNGSAAQNFYIIEIPAATAPPVTSTPVATPTPAGITSVVSTTTAFVNSEAQKDRAQMPFKVNDLQFIGVESWCPAGCDRTGAGYALMYKVKTPLLATSTAFNSQVQVLKNDYCTRPGLRSRNISIWLTFFDQFNNQTVQKLFAPSSCAAKAPVGNVGTTSATVSSPNSASSANVEDQFWDAVKSSSSPADFQAYLNNYPTGKYASLARLKISQLTGSSGNVSQITNPVTSGAPTVEDQYWNAVKNSTSARDFQSYLSTYPSGKYAPIARLKIGQLGGSISTGSTTLPGPVSSGSSVEQQYWDTIKNSRRSQDFQNYLRDYPNGQFVPIARLKISQLSSNPTSTASSAVTVEDQYWNNIFSSQQAKDFQGYLYNYPNGKYAAIARLRMSQLGASQPQNVTTGSSLEDQYWNNVKNSQRPQDFQSYLNLYPNGRYSALAQLKINQLRGSAFNNTATPFPNLQTLERLLGRAQFGSLNELLGKTKFWVITYPGDVDSKRKITKKLTKEFKHLRAALNEQDADFLVIFKLTDNTGAPVGSNTVYVNQTIKGELKVFTAKPGPNGAWNLRIVHDVTRYQSWDAAGNLTNIFGKHPADAAAGRFTTDLEKINF